MLDASSLRTRVTGLEYHRPANLADHPQQWRAHPPAQRAALEGLLAEIGIAGALLAYRSERTGQLTTIDGHLRKSLNPTIPWPILMTDLTDAEADLLLATYDPITAMATADAEALDTLMRQVTSGDAAVQALLAQVAAEAGIVPPDFQPVSVDEQGRLDEKAPITCPECGHVWTP